jgi:ankyrin repeat protein
VSQLENLRKSAKRWLKAVRSGDPAALDRLRRAYPNAPTQPVLRDVQHALARERGFDGWSALKAAAEKATASAGSAESSLAALLAAAERGDAAAVAAILDAEPTLIDQRGLLPGHVGERTALHFAVDHPAVVRELLSRGADPNIRDEGDDAYPLHFAAGYGRFEVVRMLVEAGADTYGPGTFHLLDVVGWATCFETSTHTEVARYLLARGAPLTLFPAVALGEAEAISRLAAEGADLDQRMDEQANQRRTPLHLAILKQQPRSLAALLDAGADPSLVDAAGLTPLDQAALHGEAEIADLLLAAGAALRLPAAILLGRDAEIEKMLDADPELVRDDRMWAHLLVRAAGRGTAAQVEQLLRAAQQHRAGLSIVNLAADKEVAVDGAPGYTALHAAAGAGNDPVVELLLRHGANPRARDGRFCGSPVGWARHFGHQGTAELLLAAEIDIFDAIDNDRGDLVAKILDRDPAAFDRPFGAYTPFDPPPIGGKKYWPSRDEKPLEWATQLGHENARAVLADRSEAARAAGERERAERAAEFLRAACWSHEVHGKRDHHAFDRTAQRMLAREPELARANLFTAIVCGELDEVERRLEERPDSIHEPGGPLGGTPLLTLCFTRFTHGPTLANAVAIGRLLLDRGANPDDVYMAMDAAYTALVGTAGEGEQDAPRQPWAAEMFDLLLERGAKPFDIQVLYNTHFSGDMLWWLELVHKHTADTELGAAWRDPDWKMLDMGVYGSGARFILEVALKKRNLPLAQWALGHGANPDAAPARDWRFPKKPLYQLARLEGFDAMAELLLRHGASPEMPELTDREKLQAASHRLDRAEVAALFAANHSLKVLPHAMHQAAEQDRPEVVAMLLDLGVSTEVQDHNNETPLHRAAMSGSLAVARLLIGRGAEVDPRDRRFGGAPIGWASHGDQKEMVEFLSGLSRDFRMVCIAGNAARARELLAEDPGLAAKAIDGTPPLFWLPDDEEKALAVVRVLLEHGADPAATNPAGQNAAEAARKRGFDQASAMLSQ